MRNMIAACALLISALTATTASADDKPVAFVISHDIGGQIAKYEEMAKTIGKTKLIIDGYCMSSCTMYLRTDWKLDVCYTPSALFLFHKPYLMLGGVVSRGKDASSIADLLWDQKFYSKMPDGVKEYLNNVPSVSAGASSYTFDALPYEALQGVIPECESEWWTNYTLKEVTYETQLEPR